MTDITNAQGASAAVGAPGTHGRAAPDREHESGSGAGITLMRTLVGINLGLVALQALSAGLFLSGYPHAVRMHAVGAGALAAGVLLQGGTAVVLWRRSHVPRRVLASSLVLLVAVVVQTALGHNAQYWLHVPLGVGIYGGLLRQMTWLVDDAPFRSVTRQQAAAR